MAISSGDIQKRYSVTAAAGDTTAGTAAGSLGDQVSTTQITDATVGNLFDDVTGVEAANGIVDYRCIFVLNNHSSLTLQNATVTLQSETAGGGAITLALDPIGVTNKGAATAQAAQIANETTAPSGVGAFGAGPLSIGNVGPGQCAGVWFRRTVAPGTPPLSLDGAVLRIAGDTLP